MPASARAAPRSGPMPFMYFTELERGMVIGAGVPGYSIVQQNRKRVLLRAVVGTFLVSLASHSARRCAPLGDSPFAVACVSLAEIELAALGCASASQITKGAEVSWPA